MDDALVHAEELEKRKVEKVLILVVMDDALVRLGKTTIFDAFTS